jgi:hypothetical protein
MKGISACAVIERMEHALSKGTRDAPAVEAAATGAQ